MNDGIISRNKEIADFLVYYMKVILAIVIGHAIMYSSTGQ